MKRLFFILALVCAPLAYGQGGLIANPISFTGPTGRPLAGATIDVCTSAGSGLPCSPHASIFTNAALSIASPNPVTTDGNGNLPLIFAAPGVYVLSVTGSGITPTLVTATVAGTGAGNVIIGANTGSISFTGTESDAGGTHTGPETLSGSSTLTNPCLIGGSLYVSSAGCYTTLAAAFAACPTGPSGCAIYMPWSCPAPSLALGTFDPGNIALTVYLGPCQYTVNQITIRPSLRMYGTASIFGINSAPFTTLNATGGNATPPFVLAQIAGVTGVVLADFALAGTGGNTTQNGINLIASAGGGLWYSQFDNLQLSGFGGIGVNLDAQNNSNSIHQFNTFNRVVVFRQLNGNYALQMIGRVNSPIFNNCQFDGSFNTQDGKTNINIAQGTGSQFVPYNLQFNTVTSQYAGVAFLVNGADTLSIVDGHYELVEGVLSVGTGSSFGSLNISMVNSGGFLNTGIGTVGGIGVGNGYIVNNRAAVANVSINVENFHNLQHPDNFFVGGLASISQFGSCHGPEGSCTTVQAIHFGVPLTLTISSGTATMTVAAIGAGTCGTTVTVSANSVITTDAIFTSFNLAPAANPAQLVVSSWPTTNNVNFQYCNPSAGSITPAAATLNWRVSR